MDEKVTLSLPEITQRLKSLHLPDVDSVVGIATGGTVPASLVAFHLEKPLFLIHLHYRDRANKPEHDQPRVLTQPIPQGLGQHILLVDDVSVSGSTLQTAAAELTGCQITTLVMKGRADYVLFPEIAACVNWPWAY